MINFKIIFEKVPLKNLFILSIIINLIFILLGLLANLILPPEIPLFYGLPKNSGQLTQSIFIILPSTISLVLTILNLIISTKVESNYLKKVFAFSSLVTVILSVIGTYKIIFLVGSF
jgi:hypothetical protein